MIMQVGNSKQVFATIRKKLDTQKTRYLLAGGWNTLFGYCSTIALYYAFSNRLHVIEIGVLGNIIAITMAFLTYKLFVFQTKGNWLREYFRSYLVYGGIALLGIVMLWALVDGLKMPFWQAQGLVMVMAVVISYISHARFTFL
jgi:putative flippase GtrA